MGEKIKVSEKSIIENKESEKKGPFYYFETLVNEDGTSYGQTRHEVYGESKEEAIKNLAKYFRSNLEKDEKVMGPEWGGDIRGKTPEEAAEIRLTKESGDNEDGAPWGYGSSDVWSQERTGEEIGKPESEK